MGSHRKIMVMLSLASIAGCSGGGSQAAADPAVTLVPEGALSGAASRPAPDWVLRTPRMKGNICAVGTVDPTFYRQDGVVQAGEAARKELARTIQVKISSVMIDQQSTRGSYVDESFVEDVVGTISDVVLSGAQVMETWFDDRGSVSRRGMTYALACMPTDQSVAQLAEKLKASAPAGEDQQAKIAAVRDRAKAAFDELEAMEDKKAAKKP
jgi:hypothetical protein